MADTALTRGQETSADQRQREEHMYEEETRASPTPAIDLLAGLVLPDGRRWGEAATPWQRADAGAVLTEGGPRMHYLTRPRGGSKTTDLAGVALAVLATQAPAGSRSFAFAVDADQAGIALDAAAGFVARTEGLAAIFAVDRQRITNRRTGATLAVMAADAASAYGLLPYLTIVDEVAAWGTTAGPRRLWEAVLSGMPKVAGSRLVLITTAGDPAHWSAKVLAHAKASQRWRVHEVPGPVPWVDADALEEQRALLLPSAFARLHLNQWTAPEDRLTTTDDVAACVAHDGPLAPMARTDYVVGLDVGVTNDSTVAIVAHAVVEAGRTRVVVDRVQAWTPRPGQPVDLGAVEEWLLAAHRSYNSATIVGDPWQFLSMAQRLRSAGVRVEEFTFSAQSVGRLALTLHRLLAERLVALPDDAELLEELANVRLRETSPGNYRLDHDAGHHDDRAIALALAAYHLVEVPPVAWVDLATHRDRGWYTSDGTYMAPSSWLLDPNKVGF